MNNFNNSSKKDIGYKGERCVIDKLKTMGFILFKQNMKFINTEIDIVVYRYNYQKRCIEIRIIEVKTRNSYVFDLSVFGINLKWYRVIKYIFLIKDQIIDILNKNNIKTTYCDIHYDLALVKYTQKEGVDTFNIYSYLKDINLIL